MANRRSFLAGLFGATAATAAVKTADALAVTRPVGADVPMGCAATARLHLWLQLDELALVREFARDRYKLDGMLSPQFRYLAAHYENHDDRRFGVFLSARGDAMVRGVLGQIGWRGPDDNHDGHCCHETPEEREGICNEMRSQRRSYYSVARNFTRRLARIAGAHAQLLIDHKECGLAWWVPPQTRESSGTMGKNNQKPWSRGNFTLEWIIDTERLCMTPHEILTHLATTLPGLVHVELEVLPAAALPVVSASRELTAADIGATSLVAPLFATAPDGMPTIRPELSGIGGGFNYTNTADRFEHRLAQVLGTANPAQLTEAPRLTKRTHNQLETTLELLE